MTDSTRWQDINPRDAVGINCVDRPDLSPPRNENQEIYPWPWEPQQLGGAPIGQYRCSYCYAMCVAGMEHFDYNDTAHPLTGKPVTVTLTETAIAPATTRTGVLLRASFDGEADLQQPDGTVLYLWPALDITETEQPS